MAKLLFRCNHPDFLEYDLYFIQNTLFELPETIPMDLTTFVIYLLKEEISPAFLFNFKGDSDNINSFEKWFSPEEKNIIFQDIIHTKAIDKAIEQESYSTKIKNLIEDPHNENTELLIKKLLKESGIWQKNILTNNKYYYSRHYLMDFIYAHAIEYTGTYTQEDTLIKLYQSTPLPLHLVPHKLRTKGYFYEKCILNKQQSLIPGQKNELRQHEDLHLENRVGPEQFNHLKRVNSASFMNLDFVEVDLIRSYLYQLLSAPFRFSEKLRQNFYEIFYSWMDYFTEKKIEDLSAFTDLPTRENIHKKVVSEIYQPKDNEDDVLDPSYTEDDQNNEDHRDLRTLVYKLECELIVRFLEAEGLFPKYFYYFEQLNSEAGENLYSFPIANEKYGIIYTDLIELSYDEGGLLVMECFCNQIYKLCDSGGLELSEYCHDLNIGINGWILFRSSGVEGRWNIKKYKFNWGVCDTFPEDAYSIQNEVPLTFASLNNRDLPPHNIDCFLLEQMAAFKSNNHSKKIITKRIQKYLSGPDKNSLWVTAPWLLSYYEEDINLAMLALRVDYRLYTVLTRKMQLHPGIIQVFRIKAPKFFIRAAVFSLQLPKEQLLGFENKRGLHPRKFKLDNLRNYHPGFISRK